jgi:hypothetical protein
MPMNGFSINYVAAPFLLADLHSVVASENAHLWAGP